jgi:hypothetical protein
LEGNVPRGTFLDGRQQRQEIVDIAVVLAVAEWRRKLGTPQRNEMGACATRRAASCWNSSKSVDLNVPRGTYPPAMIVYPLEALFPSWSKWEIHPSRAVSTPLATFQKNAKAPFDIKIVCLL